MSSCGVTGAMLFYWTATLTHLSIAPVCRYMHILFALSLYIYSCMHVYILHIKSDYEYDFLPSSTAGTTEQNKSPYIHSSQPVCSSSGSDNYYEYIHCQLSLQKTSHQATDEHSFPGISSQYLNLHIPPFFY